MDSLAAGGINADKPDPSIIAKTDSLPLHRYDWWATPAMLPAQFAHKSLPPAGKPMPWAEWDMKAPVSDYTVHLNKRQVDFLLEGGLRGGPGRLSQDQQARRRLGAHLVVHHAYAQLAARGRPRAL